MTAPAPEPYPPFEPEDRSDMANLFATVSYVEQYLDGLPDVDDEGDDD